MCLAIAVGFINLNIVYKPTNIKPGSKPELPIYSSQTAVSICIVTPLVVGSFLLSTMLPSLYHSAHDAGGIFEFTLTTARQFFFIETSQDKSTAGMLWQLLGFCSAGLLIGFIYIARSLKLELGNRRDISIWIYLAFILATVLGLFLLLVIAEILIPTSPELELGLAPTLMLANILTFGPPLILAVFALAAFVNVGLIGRKFDEHQREWWSRLVALIFFVAIAWLALFGISIWGSLIVALLGVGLKSAIAWLSASGIGAALGKSTSSSVKPESKGANKWLALAAQIAPFIFIIGLCLLIVYWLNVSLLRILDYDCNGVHCNDPYLAKLAQLTILVSKPGFWMALAAGFVGLLATGVLLSCRVDINVFSFHNFYRNRLTRAYLAAGIEPADRDNGKLPLTGMNDRDSPRLDRLPSRPYHLLNTALNITSSKHLSWQERKAASFFFSKKYCGYFLPGEPQEDNYCLTENYLDKDGWLSLSLPMTISGAAASPNEGYHTSPTLAFLMTVFNVRLGWWMQNTADEKHWKSKGPKLGIEYLFKELMASVDEKSPFVYLSDGGHFENLGIYELVRRECRLIVACDAGADPNYQFEDLGNAIRKCYIDLGVRIEIDTSEIKPKQSGPHEGRSLKHCAIGQIYYPGDVEAGILLYIKASMGYSEATDIEHFKATHPDFPHDPTSNQFYTESQFESYRKLGYTLCHRAFDDAKKCVETHDLFRSQSNP